MQLSDFMNIAFFLLFFIFLFCRMSVKLYFGHNCNYQKNYLRLPEPQQVVNQIVNYPQVQRRLRPRENLRPPNRYLKFTCLFNFIL